MADPAAPLEQNVFDQFNPDRGAATPSDNPDADNPFSQYGPRPSPEPTSAVGSFARGLERSAIPAIGSMPAIGAGAEIGATAGAAIGGPFAPVTGPAGALIGGVAGAFLGSTAIAHVQNWALSKLPDSWREAIGMDDRQEQIDQAEHPVASFLGGLAPYALTMRPGATPTTALPENATALQRIMAHPVTARVFGGAAMGGMELGQEEAQEGQPDWTRVAISTGFGLVFNRPTKFGEALTEAGARPVRTAIGAPQPTVAQAADAKVAGPGITESVFQGTTEQEPTSALTAQDAARTEQSVTGKLPEPDVNGIARRMEPDLFAHYDNLVAQRDEFRNWIEESNNPSPDTLAEIQGEREQLQTRLDAHIAARGGYTAGPEARQLRAQIRQLDAEHAGLLERQARFAAGEAQETPDIAMARQHLMATEFELRDVAPQVQAAYRRAADAAGTQTIEPPPETVPVAEPGTGAPPLVPEAVRAEQVAGTAPAAPPAKPIAEQKAFIAQDVANQLVAAGRPKDEAETAGKLIAARYEARAARFGGALGTAEELYRSQGAQIRGERQPAPQATTGQPEAPLALAGAEEPLAAPRAPRRPAGPASRPMETWSLLQYLAHFGGLKRNAELDTIFGGKNPFIPGFGRLFRKDGLTLDQARESAVEGRYFFDAGAQTGTVTQSTVQELLDAIDSEARGKRQYQLGQTAPERPIDADEQRYHMEGALDTSLEEIGLKPTDVSGETRERVLEIMSREGVSNPLVAYEQAVMEEDNRGIESGELKPRAEAVPGWDIPDERGAAQGTRSSIKGVGSKEVGEASRELGVGNREAEYEGEEFFSGARGKIRVAEGKRPLITLMKDANASTFLHESGHQWLEELLSDAEHPQAPADVKDDADTVLNWLGAHSAEDVKTRHHEKFARGFEQYMREGTAPSPELAGVFAKFKQWLLQIYQTIKGLGKPINEDIRGVFDRMLAEKPQRTVMAPEVPRGPTLADVHEADAVHTEPHEADAAMARVEQETARMEADPPPEIANEIAAAVARTATNEPEPEIGAGGAAAGEVEPSGGGPRDEPPGVGVGQASGKVVERGAEPRAESAGVSESGRGRSKPDAGNPLAPRPATLFGPDESPFIDKAGNIRLDNLTTSGDVAQAIRESATANDDFIGDRRGIVTDGQVMELADDIGAPGAFSLVQKWVQGRAYNAEQIIALRKLLIQSATEVSAAMKKAATGTDQDLVAYATARDRHQLIQRTVSGATAEAGRALRAFRDIKGEVGNVDEFLQTATGKTLYQLKQEVQLGMNLDTPQQVSKFMADASKRTFGRMLLEYWINSKISGPATHGTYLIGNELLSWLKAVPETATAAAIGKMYAAFGRQGARVYGGEVGAQLAAKFGSQPVALEAAGAALKSGVTTLLPNEEARALPFQPYLSASVHAPAINEATTYHDLATGLFSTMRGIKDAVIAAGSLAAHGGVEGAPLIGTRYSHLGAIPDIELRGMNVLPLGSGIRAPGRAIAAIHSYFRTVNYSMAKNGMAFRTAMQEGLEGDAFDARVADLRQNPTPEMMEQARLEATELTLMGKGSPFVQALSRLTNTEIFGFPILKFIDPFVHIAGNVIDQSLIRRTPLGILAPEIRADLMGHNGNVAQDMAMARMLVGTSIGILFGSLAAEGYASGSGPTDPNEAAMWRLAGNQAHSIRIGDLWYDTHRLGPLGMLTGIAADLYDVAHSAQEDDLSTATSNLVHAITQNILDESFMRGPAEMIRAVEDSDRYGPQYVRNFLSSFVPFDVGMAQMDRVSDPYSRQARTVMDAIKAKVPGLSETLLPRRDIWGQPMPNRRAIAPGLTSIWVNQVSKDPVNKAMIDLGIHPAQVQRKIRNVDLTDQQFDDFARIAGGTTKQRLDVIVNSPDWRTWPPHIQRYVVEEVIRQSREAARGMIMMKNPQIIRDATDAKLEKFED